MKKILLFVTSLLVLVSCTPKENSVEATLPKKEIALQLYSLRDDIGKDYASIIQKVGAMGYTAIEAANYGDGKFYGRTPAEFKADVETAGMKVLSSHVGRGLSEAEVASKDFTEALKWWDQCIADHKAAGMVYIVTPWMDKPNSLADLQTYCEYYNEIGKKCKEAGIKYGYHNHAHEFQKVEDKVMIEYMIENTNPEYVFFELDVYWVVRGQESPVDFLNKYPGRFSLLHIKDNKELGQSGMVGFDAIFKNTDVPGVEYLVVEVEKYNLAPIESVQKSLEYLLSCPLVKESYSK